jgi:hypothetical protein
LLHLFLLNFGLETDPLAPEAFDKTHLRHFLKLAIVEFTEDCSLNLVDILHLCLFGFLLNFKSLKESCMAGSLAVLA